MTSPPPSLDQIEALLARREHAAAIPLLKQMLLQHPQATDLWLALADCSLANGDYSSAAEAYRTSLTLNSGNGRAWTNFGSALANLGRNDEAMAALGRAILQLPNAGLPLANLARLHLDRNDLAEAEARAVAALKLDPALGTAWQVLAEVEGARGQSTKAAHTLADGLRHAPENANLWRSWAIAAGALPATDIPDAWASLVASALQRPEIFPAAIMPAAIALLLRDPDLETLTRIDALDPVLAARLNANSLLLAALTEAPLAHPDAEHILIHLRRLLLGAALSSARHPPLELAAALAVQAFLNEYVWIMPEIEQAMAQQLDPATPFALAVIAAYEPLHARPDCNEIAARRWPAALARLIRTHVTEPLAELRIKSAIPALTPIDDQVSSKVQAQYEANPYPRWQRAGVLSDPMPLYAGLHRRFPWFPPLASAEPERPSVLIAGCGTGFQVLACASRTANADILAVDLSRTSIAYAKRKCDELGLANVRFGQADIIALQRLGQEFDLVESMGVLHHMGDPFLGLKSVAACVRPGGLLRIGLYSELARQPIVAVRNDIARQGLSGTPGDIRAYRHHLIENARNGQMNPLLASPDLYSMSGCRDLIFHVEEHRYTIPRIAREVAAIEFEFIGFEVPPGHAQAFVKRYPDDPHAQSLENWHRYEEENPTLFSGTYMFWLRRPPLR